jgi:hypothetical protein
LTPARARCDVAATLEIRRETMLRTGLLCVVLTVVAYQLSAVAQTPIIEELAVQGDVKWCSATCFFPVRVTTNPFHCEAPLDQCAVRCGPNPQELCCREGSRTLCIRARIHARSRLGRPVKPKAGGESEPGGMSGGGTVKPKAGG